MQLLAQRTAPIHARVEDSLALLDPLLTTDRLRRVIARLHEFWAAGEPVVARWAAAEPELARALCVARRYRAPALALDVELLGGTIDAPTLPVRVLRGPDTAAVLGWLYVTEGATLGGAILRRRLRVTDANGADLAGRLQTFHPYPEGPGPMWRIFVDVLERWTAVGAGRADEVAGAAYRSFTALEEHVRSVGADTGVMEVSA